MGTSNTIDPERMLPPGFKMNSADPATSLPPGFTIDEESAAVAALPGGFKIDKPERPLTPRVDVSFSDVSGTPINVPDFAKPPAPPAADVRNIMRGVPELNRPDNEAGGYMGIPTNAPADLYRTLQIPAKAAGVVARAAVLGPTRPSAGPLPVNQFQAQTEQNMPEAPLPPAVQEARRGVANVAQEGIEMVLDPQMIAIGAGMGFAPPLLSRLISLGFSLDMLSRAAQEFPEAFKQFQAGNIEQGITKLGRGGISLLFSLGAARHGAAGKEPVIGESGIPKLKDMREAETGRLAADLQNIGAMFPKAPADGRRQTAEGPAVVLPVEEVSALPFKVTDRRVGLEEGPEIVAKRQAIKDRLEATRQNLENFAATMQTNPKQYTIYDQQALERTKELLGEQTLLDQSIRATEGQPVLPDKLEQILAETERETERWPAIPEKKRSEGEPSLINVTVKPPRKLIIPASTVRRNVRETVDLRKIGAVEINPATAGERSVINDSVNQEGVRSQERIGQEPVQAAPQPKSGPGEIGPGGILQTPEKVSGRPETEAGFATADLLTLGLAGKPQLKVEGLEPTKGKTSKPPLEQRIAAKGDKIKREYFDQFTPIQRLEQRNEAERIRMQTPEGQRLAELEMSPEQLEFREHQAEIDQIRADMERPIFRAKTRLTGNKAAEKLEVIESPYKTMRIAEGGGSGGAVPHVADLVQTLAKARKEGLGDRLLLALEWKGKENAQNIVEHKLKVRKADSERLEKELRIVNTQIERLKKDLAANEPQGEQTQINREINERNRLNLQAKYDQQTQKRGELARAQRDYQRYESEVRNKTVIGRGIGRAEIEAAQARIHSTGTAQEQARLKEFADQMYGLNRKILDAMHDEGLVNEKYYEVLSSHPEYVPNTRLIEELDSGAAHGSLGLQARQPIKKLEGGTPDTMDPVAASALYAENGIKQIWRNRAVRSLVQWMNTTGKNVSTIKLLNQYEKPGAGMGEISYYEGGNLLRFEVPQLIADTVSLTRPEPGIFTSILQRAGAIARMGMTSANLGFAVPNVVRDVKDAAALSKAGHEVITKWVGSLKQDLNDPMVRAFYESGAAYSTLQANIGIGSKGKLNPLHWIESFNNTLEQATKIATFKAMKGKGLSDLDAAWETRNYGGSPDFARKGTRSAITNILFMFSNARLQGAGRTVAGMMRDPKRMAYLLAGYTTAQLALQSWNSQFQSPEGDGTKEWDHISKNDKKNYTVFILPQVRQMANGSLRHWTFKIPKGYVEQVILNPIQDSIAAAWGHKFDAVQSVLTLGENMMPFNMDLERGHVLRDMGAGVVSSLNPVVKEPLEQAGNIDTFRKAPIVTKGQERLVPELQAGAKTSETAKAVGEKTGISPARIEHAVRGFTGGLGEQVLSITDRALGAKSGNIPVVTPIIRRFVDVKGIGQDQVYQDKVDAFFDLKEKADQAQQSYRAYVKQGGKKSADFLKAGDNRKLIVKNKIFLRASEMLGDLRGEMIAINGSKATDVVKQTKIRANYQRQLKILNTVLGSVQ